SGTLSGTLTVNAVAGVATFSTLSVDHSGTGYRLAASATGLTGATSNTFNITVGGAAQLAVTRQPAATGQAGGGLGTQPQVQVRDASGNNVSQNGVVITATISTGPGGATLTNATANTNASGLATFSGLRINGLVGTYDLTFSATSLTSATSNDIVLSAGTA